MLYDDIDNAADFEAEMAIEEESLFWTEEQWAEYHLEYEVSAWIKAEKEAEQQTSFGYCG